MNQPDILDALVVGGGIVGLMVARELLHMGLRVRLVDKAFSGPIRTHVGEMAHMGGDVPTTALYAHSLQCWAEVSTRYGSDMGLAVRGTLDLANSAGRATMLSGEAQAETGTPYAATWVANGEALATHAGTPLGPTVRGGKWWAEAPVLSTHTALETLRRDLTAKGLLIWGQDDVIDLLMEGDRITGIRIAGGETALAKHTILTTGNSVGRLLKKAGPHLPLRPARTHVLTLSGGDEVGFPVLVHRLRRGHVWMKRTREGPVMLAYDGIMDPLQATFSQKPDDKIVAALTQHAGQLIPALANATCTATSIQTAAVTPDFKPVLGAWADLKGLIIATGFGARNYVYAAGAARLVGQIIKGEQTKVDVGPFAPNRFMVGGWQKVEHPPGLAWKEPLQSAQPQLVGGQKQTDFMDNVQLVEKPEAKFASNVKQVEKKMVTAASSAKAKEEKPTNSLFPNSKVKMASVSR
ncbi:MAG: FAD-binding oxidoreductase [Alphaproteobacteria bacterium]